MKRVLYDPLRDRLIWFQKSEAGETFWDQHWMCRTNASHEWLAKNRPHLVELLVKMLLRDKKDPRILEAGCGRGQIVYHLTRLGYHIEGIDTARETIRELQRTCPQLDVRVEDVRSIRRHDNYYDIYLSLGVIEHFIEDPIAVLKEMRRVTKMNGRILISVPVINLLRRVKIKLNQYDLISNIGWNDHTFYQYAFSALELKRMFQKCGLKPVFSFPWSGIKGLKDEVPFLRPELECIEGIETKSQLGTFAKRAFDLLLATWAAHIRFFVLKKTQP